jgi:hypothetical protein
LGSATRVFWLHFGGYPSLEGTPFAVGVEHRAPEVEPLALLTDARQDVRAHEVMNALPLDAEVLRRRRGVKPRVLFGSSADRLRDRRANAPAR